METIPNFLQKQDFLQENLFRDADEQSAEQAVGQPAVAASYDSGELGRIVRAIRQAVDPERVVLFGSLAGAMPFSEMAAYDLLVVTPMHPTMEWLDLHGYLKFKYPTRSRAISFINLHLYSAAEAVGKMKWFYRMALSEGKVLYSRETVVRNPCNYEKFYFAALDPYELFSGQAGGFLAAAGRSLAAGDFRQTAFLTACAAEMLLHALYGVYYAADTDLHTLTTLLLRMRTISPELYLLLDPEQTSNSRMLSRLDVYRRDALFLFRCGPCRAEIGGYVERTQKMKELIERLCKARLALYNERR